jgi:hypothetical protein
MYSAVREVLYHYSYRTALNLEPRLVNAVSLFFFIFLVENFLGPTAWAMVTAPATKPGELGRRLLLVNPCLSEMGCAVNYYSSTAIAQEKQESRDAPLIQHEHVAKKRKSFQPSSSLKSPVGRDRHP